MKDHPKLKLDGKFLEVEIKNVHFCCIPDCPQEDITIFVGIDICVPKSRLGNVMADILNMQSQIEHDSNDEVDWQITIEKSKLKQAKLP